MRLNSARTAWRPVVGFEETHLVSESGEVMTLGRTITDRRGRVKPVRERLLRPTRKSNGYLHLTLCADGKQKTLHLHRIVLEAFVGPCPDGMEALHRNGRQEDNRLANLRWGTHRENCVDRSAHGGTGRVLNFEMAQEIRALRGVVTQAEIARKFGISKFMVTGIHRNKYWTVPLEAAKCD